MAAWELTIRSQPGMVWGQSLWPEMGQGRPTGLGTRPMAWFYSKCHRKPLEV